MNRVARAASRQSALQRLVKVWQIGLAPMLRPPLSAKAVSILEFGRIKTSRDPLTQVNSRIR
jgi:hypothetical protein